MPSIPQTYTISDFIEWNSKKQLVLDPDFQRGSVWTPSAKVFLIDTILNDLPIPQIYFRTRLNAQTQTTTREVVDGQQRLRAIVEFASNKLRLTSKSPKFKGKTYAELSPQEQEVFLSYRIPVVQLINATDAEVLEVFARLNSYSVKVTPAELRHAEFSEPVKWAIYDTAHKWSVLWSDLHVVSTRETVRLKNMSLIAELYMALDQGLGDGGESKINKYYNSKSKESELYFDEYSRLIDSFISDILGRLRGEFSETTLFDSPNFLVLFCAVAFLNGKLPLSKITEGIDELSGNGLDWEGAAGQLAELAQASDNEGDAGPYADFVGASKSSTHRTASRKVRLHTLVKIMSQDAAVA